MANVADVVTSNSTVFLKLALYTIFMFLTPALAWVGSKSYFEATDITAGIAAVLSVNVVLIVYVIDAFSEKPPEVGKEGKKAK